MAESIANALKRSVREPEAFTALYDEHAAQLLAHLTRKVWDADLALDLMAEAFAQAYASRKRFRGTTDREAAAWLYRIANRQVSRYVRRNKVEQKVLRRLGLEYPTLGDDERARVEAMADLPAARHDLALGLRRLSEEQRRALQLRIVEELPYAEVARRLAISEQAARARVSRGLRALDIALTREQGASAS